MNAKTSGNDQRKTDAILVRVSPDEHAFLRQRANACAVTVSEYVRRCALNRPIAARADIEALAELRRQGGLIKYLASTDRHYAYEYRVALNLLHEAIRRVTRDSQGSSKA